MIELTFKLKNDFMYKNSIFGNTAVHADEDKSTGTSEKLYDETGHAEKLDNMYVSFENALNEIGKALNEEKISKPEANKKFNKILDSLIKGIEEVYKMSRVPERDEDLTMDILKDVKSAINKHRENNYLNDLDAESALKKVNELKNLVEEVSEGKSFESAIGERAKPESKGLFSFIKKLFGKLFGKTMSPKMKQSSVEDSMRQEAIRSIGDFFNNVGRDSTQDALREAYKTSNEAGEKMAQDILDGVNSSLEGLKLKDPKNRSILEEYTRAVEYFKEIQNEISKETPSNNSEKDIGNPKATPVVNQDRIAQIAGSIAGKMANTSQAPLPEGNKFKTSEGTKQIQSSGPEK